MTDGMHVRSEGPLEAYAAEREALLAAIVRVLQQDDRVVAAWLIGSLGRAEEDGLSDLDVWVVFDDAAEASIDAVARDHVAAVQSPLFTVEAPQNAPRNGAYLMAIYDAPVAPHQVDWYWQPRALASIPRRARLLFDRGALLASDEGPPAGQGQPRQRAPIEAADQSIRFFWAMLMITAKHAARGPEEPDMPLLHYVYGPLADLQRFVEAPEATPAPREHARPRQKLLLLRRLAAEMAELTPAAKARGATAPLGVEAAVERYLDLIARVVKEPSLR